jgi:hypothetical protein
MQNSGRHNADLPPDSNAHEVLTFDAPPIAEPRAPPELDAGSGPVRRLSHRPAVCRERFLGVLRWKADGMRIKLQTQEDT